MGWYEVNRTGSEWGPVEGSCERGDEPSGSYNAWKFLSGCTIGSFSGRAQLVSFIVQQANSAFSG
jgi:hypothetical protein